MKRYIYMLLVSAFCLGVLTTPADAMVRVPTDEKTRAHNLVRVEMKKGVKIQVTMKGLPEFIYPRPVGVVNNEEWDGHKIIYDSKSRHVWVEKQLADFLVSEGYAVALPPPLPPR